MLRTLNKMFLPYPVRVVLTTAKSIKYLYHGVRTLLKGKLEVPVLDATAIGVSMIRGDFNTAGSTMFLLGIGEILEEWTHKKSVNDLARSMSINAEKVLLLNAEGQEVLVPVSSIMTGDSERTAAAIAKRVGVDEYYSEVLPEDKASCVEKEKALGHKVIMIGDGLNDSLALSSANVGIAISDGAAIAREIADVTISADNLHEIVTLKRLSTALMKRIHNNYRTIIGVNGGLIALGVTGVIMPTTSALLHNMSTLTISLRSMRNLLPKEETL